ncbi:MAG: TetR/AcrR family transcriptional regulator [Sedimenticolaceae bacterium]|jgi:TetR/AcrR family transcriptional regulator of autoinduction and epiphytic fitness
MNTLTLTQQKREDILDAALTEFEARGFRETSMDRIAGRAQASKRTVYNHFASKEALFDAIAAQLSERVHQVTDYPYDPALPIDHQLQTIGEQMLDMLAAPSFVSLARVTLVEMIRSPHLARKTYLLFRERQSGLAVWLAEATRDGRLLVDDPVWAADQFFGLIKSFAFWPQILGDQPIPDEKTRTRILDSSVAMFLGSYQSSGPAVSVRAGQ